MMPRYLAQGHFLPSNFSEVWCCAWRVNYGSLKRCHRKKWIPIYARGTRKLIENEYILASLLDRFTPCTKKKSQFLPRKFHARHCGSYCRVHLRVCHHCSQTTFFHGHNQIAPFLCFHLNFFYLAVVCADCAREQHLPQFSAVSFTTHHKQIEQKPRAAKE